MKEDRMTTSVCFLLFALLVFAWFAMCIAAHRADEHEDRLQTIIESLLAMEGSHISKLALLNSTLMLCLSKTILKETPSKSAASAIVSDPPEDLPVAWTPEMDAMLPIASDAEIATRFNISINSVLFRRNMLGVPRPNNAPEEQPACESSLTANS